MLKDNWKLFEVNLLYNIVSSLEDYNFKIVFIPQCGLRSENIYPNIICTLPLQTVLWSIQE